MKKQTKIQQIFQQLKAQKIDLQNFFRVKLTNHQWSDQMIKEDNNLLKDMIEGIVKSAIDQMDLMKKAIPIISDCLFLRGSVYTFFNHFKLCCKNIRKADLFETFKNLTFSDFIVLILKMSEQKDIFGQLLASIRIPLPIYFKINDNSIKMFQTLKRIMSIDRLSLILNIGSEKARSSGKTSFLFEIFSLPNYYIYQQSQFYKDSIYVHKLFPGNKNNLLIDFNGSFQKMPSQLTILHQNSGLLFIHILQKDLYDQDGQFIGAEYFKEHQNIFKYAQKIILLIRNCQQLNQEKVIQQLGKLEKKVFVFCLNKVIDSTVYFQIAQRIQQNHLFQLKKSINYFDILNDPSKTSNIQTFYKDSTQIINLLPSPYQVQTQENLTKSFFPHLFMSNHICLLNRQLIQRLLQYKIVSQQNKQCQLKKINQIQKQLADYQQKLTTGSQISQFVKKGFQILTHGIRVPQQVQVFMTMLYLWKKQMIRPLLYQYIKISKKITELGVKETKQKQIFLGDAQEIEKKLDMYDISTITILNDVITKLSYKSLTNQSKQQNLARKLSEATIEKMYVDAYKLMIPISLVDGKNLLFGNKYLKQFCQNLQIQKKSQKSQMKKVYIVSVIGAQSSGKSTLLNYLFRCQFQTSAGRCTKGMYFNICEFSDKIIFVIDTQGLLSLNAADPLFDNKIATFVLSISNIVIINNKGELTSQLKDMLQVCIFAMKYLRKEDQTGKFIPQKLIFALRDQAMPKKEEKFQQQMLSKIMTELQKSKQKLNINYKQYLDIQPQDIISFPSLFNQIDVKVKPLGTIEAYSDTFGRCVVGLRSRIMNILDKQIGRNSISDCYVRAELCWQTILNCGSNLMNYKSRQQIDAKEFILKKYEQLLPQFNKALTQNYQALFKHLTQGKTSQNLNNQQKTIKNNFVQKKQELNKNFKEKLRSSCGSITNRQEWFEVCYRKIFAVCQLNENYYMDLFNRLKIASKHRQELNEFKQTIQKEVDQLLSKNIKQKQIFATLDKKQDDITQGYDAQILNFNKIAKSYQMDIAVSIQQGFKKEKVSTNGAFWVLQFKRITFSKNYSQVFNMVKKHFYNIIKEQDEKDMQKFFKLLIEKIKEFTKTSNKISQLNELKQLQSMSEEFDNSLLQIHTNVQQLINNSRKNNQVTLSLFGYDKVKMRDILRGCLICSIAQIYSQIRLKIILDSKQKSLQLIKKQKSRIQDAFKYKNNIKQISKGWLQNIKQYYENQLKTKCQQQLQRQLDGLNKDFNPQTILNEAFRQSFLNPVSSKNKWVECFKIICDTNKYLFQIVCKQKIITTRKGISSSILRDQHGKIQQAIKNQCKKLLQSLNNQIVNKIIKTYRLIHTSQFTNEEILLVMKSFIDDAQFYNKWIQQIKASVTNDKLNSLMQKFIKQNLRDSVIGCQDTCPFCGVKCLKRKGHQDGHEVKNSCHVLSCFEGWYMQGSCHPSTYFCGSKYGLVDIRCNSIGTRVQNIGDAIYRTPLQHVQKYFPRWYNHFKEIVDKQMFQSSLQQKKYQQIWANVKQMLIKYKFTGMKDGGQFNQLKDNPLNDQDLSTIRYINLEDQQLPLSDYLQKKWF